MEAGMSDSSCLKKAVQNVLHGKNETRESDTIDWKEVNKSVEQKTEEGGEEADAGPIRGWAEGDGGGADESWGIGLPAFF